MALNPEPPEKAARGSSAKLVVKAVTRMGRRRTRAPVMSASRTGMPLARNCSTKAMSTMALVTTMPMRSRMPIMAGSPKARPVMARDTSTPISAKG